MNKIESIPSDDSFALTTKLEASTILLSTTGRHWLVTDANTLVCLETGVSYVEGEAGRSLIRFRRTMQQDERFTLTVDTD